MRAHWKFQARISTTAWWTSSWRSLSGSTTRTWARTSELWGGCAPRARGRKGQFRRRRRPALRSIRCTTESISTRASREPASKSCATTFSKPRWCPLKKRSSTPSWTKIKFEVFFLDMNKLVWLEIFPSISKEQFSYDLYNFSCNFFVFSKGM